MAAILEDIMVTLTLILIICVFGGIESISDIILEESDEPIGWLLKLSPIIAIIFTSIIISCLCAMPNQLKITTFHAMFY